MMSSSNSFVWLKNWLRTPTGGMCGMICTLVGLLLAIQAFRTFAYPVPPSFYADFSGAHWIRAQGSKDCGYFRKRIYVEGAEVTNAWIQIAAPDYYELYVNGVNLTIPSPNNTFPNQTAGYPGMEAETQFDITPYLTHGQNAICIYVRRRLGGRDPGLIVKGCIEETTSSQMIYSDTSWRAKPVPNELIGQYTWTNALTLDDTWPNAEIIPPEKAETYYQPLSIPPSVFSAKGSGYWIGPANPFEKQSYYQKDFTVPSNTSDTWLELASPAPFFEVFLNDKLVINSNILQSNTSTILPISIPVPPTSSSTTTNTSSSTTPLVVSPTTPEVVPNPANPIVLPNSSSPSPSASSSSTTSTTSSTITSTAVTIPITPSAFVVNLEPWLKVGTNKLQIRLENSPKENVVHGEILFRSEDDRIQTISTDQTWAAHGISIAKNWQDSMRLAPYGNPPYGFATKQSIIAPLPSDEGGQETFNGWAQGFFIICAWWLGWIGFSQALAKRHQCPIEEAYIMDLITQIPLIMMLFILWLAQIDVRISPEAPYQPYIFYLLLLFSIITRLAIYIPDNLWDREVVPVRPRGPINGPGGSYSPATPELETLEGGSFVATSPQRPPGWQLFLTKYWFKLSVISVVTLAFCVRLCDLNNFPLDYDETFIRNCVHGIVERGWPSTSHGDLVYKMTTYELVPWLEALCGVLTGWQDWSLRVPALIFGTMTTGLLCIFGAKLFNRATGILAALCYSCNCLSVYWSCDLFHMSQCQFSALLCFYFFYRAIEHGNGVNIGYFRLACITFCTTYLSWEGAGFILPAYTLVLLIMHPTDWRWARQFYFWAGLAFVCSMVIVQLANHSMTLPAYLGLGIGLSDLTTPSLAFLDPNVQMEWYYLHFIQTPPHFVPALFAFLGLFFYWNVKPIRYVLSLYFILLTCFSALLAVEDDRYAYFYQTLLILGAAAVIVRFFHTICELAHRVSKVWPDWPAMLAKVSLAVMMLFLFLSSGQIGVLFFRITSANNLDPYFVHYNDLYFEDKTSSLFVFHHLQPGDGVISMAPHLYKHYTGMDCYGDNPLFLRRMYYIHNVPASSFGILVDRCSGTFAIHSNLELLNFYRSHKRVWFLAAPYLLFLETADPFTINYVTNQSEVVYDDTSARVYLSDGYGATLQSSTIADSSLPVAPPPLVFPPSSPPILVQPAVSPSETGLASILYPATPNPLSIVGSIVQDGPTRGIQLGTYYTPPSSAGTAVPIFNYTTTTQYGSTTATPYGTLNSTPVSSTSSNTSSTAAP